MDLLTPLPGWMKDEMGWKPPEHAALLDGDRTVVRVTDGDEETFRKRYASHLGRKLDGGFQIKGGGAWIKLVAALIRDGILPYAPQPIAAADWDAHAKSKIALRDYQEPFLQEFRNKGAVFYNLPPGGGKTYLALHILIHIKLPVLILAPSIILCEQWKVRAQEYAPTANVTILTYASGKKALEKEWGLVIFDEVQTLPADTFSKLAFLKTKYRIGLSASPWREDGRQHMIAALSGFPCAIRWADLIRAGVLKRPRIVIVTVPNDTAKTRYAHTLIAKRKPGRALLFCDYLERGQALANALGVPFVSGETPNKLKRVQEAEVCVVSRIADRGLDFPDLTLIVEVAFLGSSREQEAQRLGRLLHGQTSGEHYLLFTPDEYAKFKPRIYGIESELAGEVDIEFVSVGNVAPSDKFENHVGDRTAAPRRKRLRAVGVRAARPTAEDAPTPEDEISRLMRLPSVAAKIAKAEAALDQASASWVKRVFRISYRPNFSPEEIIEGLGRSGGRTISRCRAACKAMSTLGLLTRDGTRYGVNRDELNRLRTLAAAINK